MCSVCLQTPCDPRCPNASAPKGVEDCIMCEKAILPGEEYAKINGVCYCESCLEDMPLCVLVALGGGEWHSSENGDEDYAVIDGTVYDESVLEDMPFSVLIPMLDGEWNTAREEDREDGSDWED